MEHIIITLPNQTDAIVEASTRTVRGRVVAEVGGIVYLPLAFTTPSETMLRNLRQAERRAQ